MTWTKLSDDFGDDCWTLSDEAYRLHSEALIYSNRKLLNCVIPKDDVRRFAKHPDAAAELVACGFWTDEDSVYVIRHHARYQRLREQVIRQQEANRNNGRRGGRPTREQVHELSAETDSVSEPRSESKTDGDRPGQDRAGNEQQPRTDLQRVGTCRCCGARAPVRDDDICSYDGGCAIKCDGICRPLRVVS